MTIEKKREGPLASGHLYNVQLHIETEELLLLPPVNEASSTMLKIAYTYHTTQLVIV